ncbi:PTS sorbose transporter subunit IIB [Maledivibacter halophilus]|uniref:PTS system, glucitol/sorbitol-specific IIB component n=1 Tax=Maledivibacter halophilus TaxID=36842 RepID=A0A1T5M800_9FIRM|nr:PTS sorbose transporter subunit IIB [Maledivibacter halophilus]SKC84367.1 PTS system, glucitol/sorbitol-specific IIB component [Maledivibacter halophilus]
MNYKSVKISKGSGGWGGPIIVNLDDKKNKIVYLTSGAKPDVAEKIAELTGGELVDGFRKGVKDSEIACVIINCGGTLRCGIYPQKKIPTINIMNTGRSGPLAKFIKEDIYVSGVKIQNIELI